MNTLFKAATCAAMFATPLALLAQNAKSSAATPSPSAATATAPAPKYTTDQVLETWGWFLGRQMDLAGLDLTKEEITALAKGLYEASQNQSAPYELEKIGPDVQAFLKGRSDKVHGAQVDKGTAESTKFFASLDGKPGIQKTDSGLYYQIVKKGNGTFPKPTDTVTVDYKGSLVSGKVFDQTEPGNPAKFQLNQVIPGWTEGLQKISEGGEIKLYIPAKLGYGEQGKGDIPPASALIFDVKLLKIDSTAPSSTKTAAPADANGSSSAPSSGDSSGSN